MSCSCSWVGGGIAHQQLAFEPLGLRGGGCISFRDLQKLIKQTTRYCANKPLGLIEEGQRRVGVGRKHNVTKAGHRDVLRNTPPGLLQKMKQTGGKHVVVAQDCHGALGQVQDMAAWPNPIHRSAARHLVDVAGRAGQPRSSHLMLISRNQVLSGTAREDVTQVGNP